MTIELNRDNILAFTAFCTFIGGLYKYFSNKRNKEKTEIADEIKKISENLEEAWERISTLEGKSLTTEIIVETVQLIRDTRDRLIKLEMKCNIYHKEKE